MRYTQLDGLRGIAALSVFFSHIRGINPTNNSFFDFFSNTPVAIFWDGAAAVKLFFVLSGFCIATPYMANNINMKYIEFILRRIFRLYPAYILSLIICLLLKNEYDVPPDFVISNWGMEFWKWKQIPFVDVLNHFSLIGSFDTNRINPPIWSLVIEMRIAFLLPFFLLIIKHINEKRFLITTMILFVAITLLIGKFTYSVFFIMGILMSKYLNYIINKINDISKLHYLCIILLAFSLYSFRIISNKVFIYFGVSLSQNFIDIITSIGSAIIIIISFRKATYTFLSKKVFAFLGNISYSLYLCHFPIMLMIYSNYEKFNNNSFFMIFSALSITFFISYAIYRFIEIPFVNYGKTIINIYKKENIVSFEEFLVDKFSKFITEKNIFSSEFKNKKQY